MAAHIYGDCVYFKNMIDTHNQHHDYFILNQIPGFHIIFPLKLMDDIFESFPKVFFDIM